MNTIMLAAGRGTRLSGSDNSYPPKCLIEIGGRTLLHRHLAALEFCGIPALNLVTGYQSDVIITEIEQMDTDFAVSTIFNPNFHQGSSVSLWTARKILAAGHPVLLMDADVLYAPEMLQRLVNSPHPNCLLYDRTADTRDDEAVKIAIDKGKIVEFGKIIAGSYDVVGEWPGFIKFSGAMAAKLGSILERDSTAGKTELSYETALAELIFDETEEHFGIESTAGSPWIEIDFPDDLKKAEDEVLPQLNRRN